LNYRVSCTIEYVLTKYDILLPYDVAEGIVLYTILYGYNTVYNIFFKQKMDIVQLENTNSQVVYLSKTLSLFINNTKDCLISII